MGVWGRTRDYGTSVSLLDEPEATTAAALVAAELAAGGRITFARFMELALYAPGVGYYEARAPEEFSGDYVTSPQLHPAFGVLLCGQIEEMWRRLGRPDQFWLIEGGPGSGVFAADILTTAEDAFPDFARALRVALLERCAPLREVQQAKLARWSGRVCWLDGQSSPPLGPGCVFANELLDALPTHRVVMRGEGLREIYIESSNGSLGEVEDVPRVPLQRQVETGRGQLRLGDRGEVNLKAPRWLESAAKLIEQGYLLLLDYGEPAHLLYGERHARGTLRCYFQHTMNEEPYRRIGQQDITAHVDLSAIFRAAEASGLALLGATHQTRLLDRLGLGALRRRVDVEIASRPEQRAHHAALDLLSGPHHLGRVSVLLLGKNAPATGLAGFSEGGGLTAPRSPRALEARAPDPFGLVESLRR